MKGKRFTEMAFEQMARIAAAFGSPSRIAIIDLLAQGERNVESVASGTGLSVANASRHLGILKTTGLLSSRKEGLQVFYALAGDDVFEGYRALMRLAESRVAELGRIASEYFDLTDGMSPLGLEELMARVRRGESVVVDVRPGEEYEAGHIEGALSIPLETLEKRLAEIPPGLEVVAYCRGPYCFLAAEAVKLLRKKGRKAARLEEGFPDWKGAGLPVEKS